MNKRNRRLSFKGIVVIVLLILNAAMIGVLGFYVVPTYKNEKLQSNQLNEMAEKEKKEESKPKTSEFSFVGVGDNLIHDPIFFCQEEPYNFDPVYENTKKYTKEADLAYINAETIMAGKDFELSGYPMFNGPTELIDSLAHSGFDWISVGSNHTLDRGVDGLQAQLDYIAENYPEMTYTGSRRDPDEEPVVRNVNGIKVGMVGYTYGLNGLTLPEGKEWMIDMIDPDKIRADLEELNKISDVQIVTMHWGTEYHTEIEPEQEKLMKLLNEMGVEVVIGSHPHVIKPVEMYHGKEQDTLVYYSLGNFISCQNTPETMVGGMASFDLKYDFNSKKTTFDNIKFTPTVTYASKDFKTFRTNTIHEYTEAMVKDQWQETQSGRPCTIEFVNEFVKGVMEGYEDENIEVVYSE